MGRSTHVMMVDRCVPNTSSIALMGDNDDLDEEPVSPTSPGRGSWTRVVSETPGKSFRGGGQKYDVLDLLGEGSYGSVYRCSRVADGALFAVKIVDPRKMAFAVGSVNALQCLEVLVSREVEALRRLSAHPGIVTIQEVMWSKLTRQTFIVTELVLGKNLFHAVSSRIVPFKEPEVAHVVAQLANALAFCHSQRVAHRDVKLENVLVSSASVDLVADQAGAWQTCELYEVKLCDFGLAKVLQGPNTTRSAVGTSAYTAPEITRDMDCEYDAMKADAYSLGVMAFVMLCLEFPGQAQSSCEYWNKKNWSALSPVAKSFVSNLLEPNPLARHSTAQASYHQLLAHEQLVRADQPAFQSLEFECDSSAGTGAAPDIMPIDCTSPGTGATPIAATGDGSKTIGNLKSFDMGQPKDTTSIGVSRSSESFAKGFSSSGDRCGCRKGLKKLLQSFADKL